MATEEQTINKINWANKMLSLELKSKLNNLEDSLNSIEKDDWTGGSRRIIENSIENQHLNYLRESKIYFEKYGEEIFIESQKKYELMFPRIKKYLQQSKSKE